MRALELFSGAGGMALGVSQAGYSTDLLVDDNSNAISTLRTNRTFNSCFEDAELFHDDISAIDFSEYSDSIDLLAAGPPCQPFSNGGKRQGNSDSRDLFPHVVKIINQVKPKAFIIENVKGIRSALFRNYLEYIRLHLTHSHLNIESDTTWEDQYLLLQDYHNSHNLGGASYKVSVHWINSADYGIPQMRERVFIIGFRSDIEAHWSFPNPTHSSDALLWEKFETKSYWRRNNVGKRDWEEPSPEVEKILNDIDPVALQRVSPWSTIRESINDLPPPAQIKSRKYSHHEFRPGAKIYPGHTGSGFDLPAKTIKAGVHGVPGGENMIRFKDGSVRYFTIRELARIQSFPDFYTFSGSWSQMVRQIGNAVPVKLAELIASSIKHAMEPTLGSQN